ncbi:MAG: HPF/RaiA family ribosome-associated protein [Myxococcota bacterium]
MNLEVSFRNLRARDEIKVRAQALFDKLERFLDAASEGGLVVAVEHDKAIMELVVRAAGETHTVTEEDDDLRTALDRAFHTMEVRLRRSKERRIDRSHASVPPADGFTTTE